MMPPFTTALLDPAIDEEDYPSVIAVHLRHARSRVEDAKTYEGKAKEEASAYVEAVEAQEKALWQEFEDYLLQALLWQEKQTGSAQLPCAVGFFHLQEAPPALAVDDLVQVQQWVMRLSYDLVLLGAQLSAFPANTLASHAVISLAPPHGADTSDPTRASAEEIVTDFHRRTGLLPNGCHFMPPRRMPVLCPFNQDTHSGDISTGDTTS